MHAYHLGLFSLTNIIPLTLQAMHYAQEAMKLSGSNKQRSIAGEETGEAVDGGCGAGDDPAKLVQVINLLKNKPEVDIQEPALS